MHEPARGGGLASVKAFAIEPEAVAVSVFDEVVVARQGLLRTQILFQIHGWIPAFAGMSGRVKRAQAPPFAGDAFGSLSASHFVGHAAPAETPRRAIGNERGDLGRLGARQQQQRACCLLRFWPRRYRRRAFDRREYFS